MTPEPDIAIVGAGAAGIGAAMRLASSGLSIVVLEALPRVGGRAWTQMIAGLPLDLGCGWLHSADRNPWRRLAEEKGWEVDRRTPAWGAQYHDLGFPPEEREAARKAFDRWNESLTVAQVPGDCAADFLNPADAEWTPYIQAMSGFLNGDELERVSAQDYAAYDRASTDNNWRTPKGYGALIAACLPAGLELHVDTPVHAIRLEGRRLELATRAGEIRPRCAILTMSTSVLAGGELAWPPALDPWREAASRLPLGANEKLFLRILGASPFEPETSVLGDPKDAATGAYYIRPFGRPVIECFVGGAGARAVAEKGEAAAFARALDQLGGLFGSGIRRCLEPMVASDWAGNSRIGGGYSHALPGKAAARGALARPFDNRLFFAGEATHATDFSTAHGAFQSGVRAAEEALAALSAGGSLPFHGRKRPAGSGGADPERGS